MKNEFILHLTAPDISKQEKLIKDLLQREFHSSLTWKKMFKKSSEVFYRIQTSSHTLIRLKKKLDAKAHFESFELFEYRSW